MTLACSGLDQQQLLSAARDPHDAATRAFSGVLSRFPLIGLEAPELMRLLSRYFPAAGPTATAAQTLLTQEGACSSIPPEEFDDLLELFREHRRDDSEETGWLAHTIASACAGQNHLWEDMAMPNREALSQLIKKHFPTLYFKNTANLRWKKFFYKLLCDRAQAQICKAPSCGVCSDYAKCFGPE